MKLELKQEKYLDMLFGAHPSAQAICRDIIDLNAVLNKSRKQKEYWQKEEYDCEI